MKPKTTIIELAGRKYQIGKFPPDVGSYILRKLLRAGMKAGEGAPVTQDAPEPAERPSGEQMARMLAGAMVFGDGDFESHTFIQNHCMAVCSRMEAAGAADIPMPVANSVGAWAIYDVRDDLSLVLRLTVEAMVFNFTDFFDQGGMEGAVRV